MIFLENTYISMDGDIIDCSVENINYDKEIKKYIKNNKKIYKNKNHFQMREHKSETEICIICRNEIKEDERINEFKCKHKFHTECIMKWLEEKLSCPCCRKKIELETDEKIIMKLIIFYLINGTIYIIYVLYPNYL